MASQDDINSTLKNIVSNVGLLANATAVAASINSVQTAIVNLQTFLSTALATTHLFGGTITLITNQFSALVANPAVVSNSVLVFSPANSSAALFVKASEPFVSTITPGVNFLFNSVAGSSIAGGEIFTYIGYNP